MRFVAEIGSNWIGNCPKKDMVEMAIEEAVGAGATAVKFQYFTAAGLYSKTRAPELYERTKGLELGQNALEWAAIKAAVAGVELWVSVFDVVDVSVVGQYADVIKIASGDLNNLDLISDAAEIGKPMAISTGGGLDFEIENALDVLGGVKPILFYCVSEYPAPSNSFRLGSVVRYKGEVREIGFSDHSAGSYVATLAAAMGYTVFEKHFKSFMTSDKSPDYDVSANPNEFKKYVVDVETAAQIAGGSKKMITPAEAKERVWARRGRDGLRPTEDAVRFVTQKWVGRMMNAAIGKAGDEE